jgi:hypothetical protein
LPSPNGYGGQVVARAARNDVDGHALLQMTTSSRPCAGTHTPCDLVSALWRTPSFTTHARGDGSRRGGRDDVIGFFEFIKQQRDSDTPQRSRSSIRPSFANSFAPERERAQRDPQERAQCDPKRDAGKTGCALHPRSHVQKQQTKTHMSIQVQRKHSGLPCAMVVRLIPCSPRRDQSLFVTVVPRKRELLANLTPAIGASGPHGFAVRFSHARDDRETPLLVGTGWR